MKLNSKSWMGLGALAVIIMWAISAYNGMVTEEQKVNLAWGNVQTDYQRRYDLIPNLVNVVKGYANHEEKVFVEVTEARNKATQMTLQVDSMGNFDEEYMERFNKAQAELQGSLSRLMAITENYPELKANEQFLKLQDQLEGTENRIKESRQKYNQAAADYNIYIKTFPRMLLAGIFGFKEKPMFKADEGAEKRVDVEF